MAQGVMKTDHKRKGFAYVCVCEYDCVYMHICIHKYMYVYDTFVTWTLWQSQTKYVFSDDCKCS